MRIFVNTPNGHIGRAFSNHILDAGHSLVALARDPAKSAALAARGATIVQGSTSDPAALDQALAGVDALLWVSPPLPGPDWRTWGPAAAWQGAGAAWRAGVKKAVVLSSIGAQARDQNGPIGGLLPVEDAFRAALPDVVALRAGFFFENTLGDLGGFQGGTVYGPYPGTFAAPWVATADIAAVAAEEAQRLGDGHRVRGVHGPRDLSYGEVVQIVGGLLGREIGYQQVPVAGVKQAMLGFGLPEFVVNAYGEMFAGALSGALQQAEPRTAETTTPTDYADWAATALLPALGG